MTWVRVAVLLGGLTIATPALCQNSEDQNTFDFSLPGARSRAIGGAFVAVADDATSVYSNPAGLTQLFRPEVSLEVRHWNLTSRVLNTGHGFGPATGIGVDTIDGFVDEDFTSNVTGVSFASFVYPREKWAVGVFRHQLARFKMNRQIVGPFFDCSGGSRQKGQPPFCEEHAVVDENGNPPGDGVDREFPKIQSSDLDIHSYGAAGAYDFSDRLSAGFALQYFSLDIDATNTVYTARGGQKYQPPDYSAGNVEVVAKQFGEDNAWAINAGVLYRFSPRFVVGASYRQGPKFEFSTDTRLGPKGNNTQVSAQDDNPFHVPDTFSAGTQVHVSEFWRVSFEYDRVNYHQLIDDFRNTSLFGDDPEFALVTTRIQLPDANQFRFGAERLLLISGSRVIAFRGGVWYDPNHQTYFDGDPDTGLPAPRWAVLFPKRDGNMHVSAGAGFTARRHLQFDAAVDFSDLVKTFSVSSVWRF